MVLQRIFKSLKYFNKMDEQFFSDFIGLNNYSIANNFNTEFHSNDTSIFVRFDIINNVLIDFCEDLTV